MTTLINAKFETGIIWSNIASDGSFAVAPNDTPLLLLTAPVRTGTIPLIDGLYALLTLSWNAKSANVGQFSIAENNYSACAVGAALIANMGVLNSPFASLSPIYGSLGPGHPVDYSANKSLRFDAPVSLYQFVQILPSINASGDLEVYLMGKSTDGLFNAGVNWSFSDLSAEYQIVGNV